MIKIWRSEVSAYTCHLFGMIYNTGTCTDEVNVIEILPLRNYKTKMYKILKYIFVNSLTNGILIPSVRN